MLYCFDSHTFVWAVKKQAEPHDIHKLEESARLIKWVDKSKHQIIVPAIVIAECLIREPESNHAPILAEAYKRFIVAEFDGRCALKYGELLRLEKWESAKSTQRENSIRREKMKIDHMIVACALVYGARGIFSEDAQLEVFAKPHLDVFSPRTYEQIEKF